MPARLRVAWEVETADGQPRPVISVDNIFGFFLGETSAVRSIAPEAYLLPIDPSDEVKNEFVATGKFQPFEKPIKAELKRLFTG